MTPYYHRGGIAIYHGDAREILPRLAFDWICADPPYGIDHPVDYNARGRGKLAAASNYAPIANDDEPFDPSWIVALDKPTLLWGANHYADKLPPSGGWIVWDKKRPHDLDQSTAELAWSNYVRGVRVFRHLWHGMMRDSERGEGALVHPMQKPLALHRWTFALRWCPKGIVADPYMGSGSLLAAALSIGRPAIGIETSEHYCQIAAERLDQASRQAVLL